MMVNPILETARLLEESAHKINRLPIIIGFDGFIDEIVRLVDKKTSATSFSLIPTISSLANRLTRAAGQSTNIEAIVNRIKLGGNGPIMANAMAKLGFSVTYIGNLGFPEIHPVFQEFARKTKVYSIAEPGHTDALEFEDGKIMLGKYQSLNEINYENIIKLMGCENFDQLWQASQFYGLVNWTMIQSMTEIWQKLLANHCQAGAEKVIFFDLADPEKRTDADVQEALMVIGQFSGFYRVFLGCNEKESMEIARILGIEHQRNDVESLKQRAASLRSCLHIDTVVIHPTKLAVAAAEGEISAVDGPFLAKPRISTGGGDHFNAGFCLGILSGFHLDKSLLLGVATSGYYVRKAASPTVRQLAEFLREWSQTNAQII